MFYRCCLVAWRTDHFNSKQLAGQPAAQHQPRPGCSLACCSSHGRGARARAHPGSRPRPPRPPPLPRHARGRLPPPCAPALGRAQPARPARLLVGACPLHRSHSAAASLLPSCMPGTPSTQVCTTRSCAGWTAITAAAAAPGGHNGSCRGPRAMPSTRTLAGARCARTRCSSCR